MKMCSFYGMVMLVVMGMAWGNAQADILISDADIKATLSRIRALADEVNQLYQDLLNKIQPSTGNPGNPGNPNPVPPSTPPSPQQKLNAGFGNPPDQGIGNQQQPPQDLSNISICFQYQTFGGLPPLPKDQNIAPENSVNCAVLNSMTPSFPDITNAKINWGLNLPVNKQVTLQMTNTWTDGIQLCVRGKTSANGQCNGRPDANMQCVTLGPPHNMLQYINLVNPNFGNSNPNNKPGCALSWAVVLPVEGTPDYAKKLNLCVQWQKMDDPTSLKKVCAQAGPSPDMWTSDFFDDSTENSGYYVQWGLSLN